MAILPVVFFIFLFQFSLTRPEEDFPKVYVLLEGYDKPVQGVPNSVKRSGTVTLVIVGDKSIVVDTGTSNHAHNVSTVMSDRYGIDAYSISMLIATHTHPDHYQNALLFHPSTQFVYKQKVIKDEFIDTTLKDSPHWASPLGISELTILYTPGHTAIDVSLIVRNYNNTQRSLAIVGDLFLDANDHERSENGTGEPRWKVRSQYPTVQRHYRKVVGCLVDDIIPGHGPMFQVSEEMKNVTLACNSGQRSAQEVSLIMLYLTSAIFVFSVRLCVLQG